MGYRWPSPHGGLGPTGDPTKQGLYQAEAKQEDEELAAVLRNQMSTENGRAFTYYLLDVVLSRGQPIMVAGDPYSTAANAGVHDRGNEFEAKLQNAAPLEYALMMREQNDHWFRRAEQAKGRREPEPTTEE